MPDYIKSENSFIPPDPALIYRFQLVAKIFAILIFSAGCIVIFGWLFNSGVLKSILPVWVSMKANTAVCFMLIGVCLWFYMRNVPRWHIIVLICPVIIAAAGLLILIQYIAGLDFGIDQLLFNEPHGTPFTSSPGRMAPNTAINFLLIGTSLLLIDAKNKSASCLAQWLAVAAGLITMLPITGYIIEITSIRGFGGVTPMAFNTSIAFFLSCLGILFARPDRGLMLLVSSGGAGSVAARRLLPAGFLIPFFLASLFHRGIPLKLYDSDFALALTTLFIFVLFMILICFTARSINNIDAERKRAVEKAKALNLELVVQLYRSQKMDAVGKMTAGIVHDLNNTVQVITGGSQMLMAEIGANSPLQSDVEEIEKAGNHAKTLLKQLLLFCQNHPIEYKALNLNNIIANFRKMLARIIGKNILIETFLEPNLDSINADEGQIEQIIMNLAINARDAMPQGGTFLIKTENINLDETFFVNFPAVHDGKYICLSVTDSGIGIDKETIKHIFEPFFTTKGAEKGTGLGLSVVHRIVKHYKGWFDVLSEPGKGTTFKIFLPVFEEPAGENPA